MLQSTPPPATRAGNVEANRSEWASPDRYKGLMPSRSRTSRARPPSRSTRQKANMPARRCTNESPQWW